MDFSESDIQERGSGDGLRRRRAAAQAEVETASSATRGGPSTQRSPFRAVPSWTKGGKPFHPRIHQQLGLGHQGEGCDFRRGEVALGSQSRRDGEGVR